MILNVAIIMGQTVMKARRMFVNARQKGVRSEVVGIGCYGRSGDIWRGMMTKRERDFMLFENRQQSQFYLIEFVQMKIELSIVVQ